MINDGAKVSPAEVLEELRRHPNGVTFRRFSGLGRQWPIGDNQPRSWPEGHRRSSATGR